MVLLGKTELLVSRIGLGADHFGTAIDEKTAESILDFVNNRTLVVGLKEFDFNAFFGGIIIYHSAKVGIGALAVNSGFSYAEHIDIGSVNYKDTHLRILLTVSSGSSLTSTV